MFKRRNKKRSVILTLLLTLLLAVAAYAFTAANTFPNGAPSAGDGSATISGYAVDNISYTVNAAGDTITGVDFDLDAAASHASVSVHSGDTLSACSNTSGFSWSCTGLNVSIASADELRVVAY
jgi:hypothetical protein